jgi:hypothetical protein
LAVAGTAVASGAFDTSREGAGAGKVEGIEVDLGKAAVEPNGLVGHGQREGDGVVGADDPELAGGDGDTRLAAAT